MPTLEKRLFAASLRLPHPDEDAEQRAWEAIVDMGTWPARPPQRTPTLRRGPDLSAPRRRRWARPAAAIAAVGLTVAVGVTVAPFRGGPSLVDRATAALNRPGLIEHVRLVSKSEGQDVGQETEYWSLEDKQSRVRTALVTGDWYESVGPYGICSALSRRSSTANSCVGTGEAIRQALESGEARVLGDGVVEGREVTRIAFAAKNIDASGVYEVDRETMLPVRLTATMGGPPTTEEYSIFEYLPATDDNLALLQGSPGAAEVAVGHAQSPSGP